MPDNEMKEKITEELKDVKRKSDVIVQKAKDSKLGKAVLGEDGKFDKEDVDRLTDQFKETKVGKALLGEDGKFDGEDLQRIGGNLKEAGEKAVEKVKELLDKE